jgi:hypothetical protein
VARAARWRRSPRRPAPGSGGRRWPWPRSATRAWRCATPAAGARPRRRRPAKRRGPSPRPRSPPIAERYERRAAEDRERLARIEAYAQTALCRWRHLLDELDEALPEAAGAGPWERCGHCDNCRRPLDESAVPRASEGLLRGFEADLAAVDLAVGEPLSIPVYGRGTVEQVAGDRVIVAFPDGEERVLAR